MTEDNKPYSFQSLMSTINNNFAVILISGLVFIGGFMIGSVWTENNAMKSGTAIREVAGGLGANNPNAVGDPSQAQPPGPQGPSKDQLSNAPEVSKDDHIRGDIDAKVILVEYSDFECPFCKNFHPTLQEVIDEYGDDVAWVYRHYPLPFHANAQKAAEASECVAQNAGEDAFWKFNDLYLETTDSSGTGVSIEEMSDLAEQVGANKIAVANCIESGEMEQKVKDIMDAGSAAGITGTPGTIIITKDGAQELIPGALPATQVKEIVEKYL